ncbi:glycosyltransferase [Kiritimatiellaeota bacterium B1221]|nr:glycosyltransferase [Kiritimatiellaeota bacterium B1221]
MTDLQLILPVYQDREALEKLLPTLLKQGWKPEQITVIDASEVDAFPLENPWNVHVYHPPSSFLGRAGQMNFGVQQTQSAALLFLHVDSFLPDNAQTHILHALQNGNIGGGFSRRFDSPSLFLQFTCLLADLRGKWFGWYFGDQAIFCSRSVFDQVGGYPDIAPFEDLEFCRKLKKQGSLTLLKPGIVSSARRFQEGPVRKTFKDFCLTVSYFIKNPQLQKTASAD